MSLAHPRRRSVMATRRRIFGSSIWALSTRGRGPAGESAFSCWKERSVDFFDVAFHRFRPSFEDTRADGFSLASCRRFSPMSCSRFSRLGLLVGRDVDAPDRAAGLRSGGASSMPIANIRGAAFLAGLVALNFTNGASCSSSRRHPEFVMPVLTGGRSIDTGRSPDLQAAARLATPGEATGPGGRPLCI